MIFSKIKKKIKNIKLKQRAIAHNLNNMSKDKEKKKKRVYFQFVPINAV